MFNLTEQGYRVDIAHSGSEALSLFAGKNYQLVITDMKMPGMDGTQVLKELHRIKPDIMVIMITAFASVEMAVEAMKQGAYDYITKPINLDDFNLTVKHALERYGLLEENAKLKKELKQKGSGRHIITVSDNMLSILQIVKKIAPSTATVLIQGESGTGK